MKEVQQRSKKISVLLIVMTMVFMLVGCGTEKSSEVKSNNESQATSSQTSQVEQAASDEIRTITDTMGTVEIKGTPQRIVTLYQGATDAAVALNVTPIGAVESWSQQPVYEYLRNDLPEVVNLGVETQPNLEEISKLKPDLIIASNSRHLEVYEQLKQIAPTVMIDPLYDFKNTLNVMSQALNKEAESKELIAKWEARVVDFNTKIEAKLGDSWPMSATVLNFRADHARIYVTGFAGDILDELGFIRSDVLQAEADKGTVHMKLSSVESIPTMNANTIFIFKFDDNGEDEVQKMYQDWTSHPLWNELEAVKSDQVYLVDEVSWNVGGGIISANLMLDDLYEKFGLEK